VNWRLYRSAPSGRDEDRVEVTSHAALDLWNAPNPFTTGPAFREATQQHEELTGEQWWVIVRDGRFNIPLEVWPVRPDRMEPIPDPQDFLVGYIYRGPSGERIPLGVDDVLFLRRPNPIDPYRGMGVVQTILTDLDATKASAEWNRNFFLNSAEPGGIVEVDRRLDDEEFNEFRERWAEQHRGVSNAHRVGVLENGLKWVDRKYSMRDMEFTELRNVNREIIREAFGFPKPMLGSVDDVNRANAEAAAYVFAAWLIRPRLAAHPPAPEHAAPADVRGHRPGPGVRLRQPRAGGPRRRRVGADRPRERRQDVGRCRGVRAGGAGRCGPARHPVRPARREPGPRAVDQAGDGCAVAGPADLAHVGV
jgi:HK97 family phage portal protein